MGYAVFAFTVEESKDSPSLQARVHCGALPDPAEYGKQASGTRPDCSMNFQAAGSMPPLHPMSPLSQLTISSGERTGDGLPLAMATRSLNTSEAEKAQQLPHCC